MSAVAVLVAGRVHHIQHNEFVQCRVLIVVAVAAAVVVAVTFIDGSSNMIYSLCVRRKFLYVTVSCLLRIQFFPLIEDAAAVQATPFSRRPGLILCDYVCGNLAWSLCGKSLADGTHTHT